MIEQTVLDTFKTRGNVDLVRTGNLPRDELVIEDV